MTVVAEPLSDSARNDGVMIPLETITIPWFLPVREEELHSRMYLGIRDGIKNNRQHVAIKVRPVQNGFELIDGFLRLSAMRELGMKEIRAVVVPATDEELMSESITINKDRIKDNPIILGQKCAYFLKYGHHTQEWVAEKVGLSRTSVAHHVRLLDLHEDVQKCVAGHNLTYHHALLLLRIKDLKMQVQLAEEAVTKHLSTRDLEARIARFIELEYAPPRRGTISAQALAEAEEEARSVPFDCFGCKKTFRFDQLTDIGENHQLYCPGCAPDAHIEYEREKARAKRLEEAKQASQPHKDAGTQQNSEAEELEKTLDLTRELKEEGLPIETDVVLYVLELRPHGIFKDVNMAYFIDGPHIKPTDKDRNKRLRELYMKHHPDYKIRAFKLKDNTKKDAERVKSLIRMEHEKLLLKKAAP